MRYQCKVYKDIPDGIVFWEAVDKEAAKLEIWERECIAEFTLEERGPASAASHTAILAWSTHAPALQHTDTALAGENYPIIVLTRNNHGVVNAYEVYSQARRLG